MLNVDRCQEMEGVDVPAAKRVCSMVSFPKRIAVEGNIATGKTTFLKMVADHSSSYQVIGEPLSRWTNVPSEDEDVSCSQENGSNLLDLFYKDQKRWAYTFQTYACLSRLRAQLEDPPSDVQDPVLFYERSVYSDKFCFAQNCHEMELMNPSEWAVYCDWHSFLVKYLKLQFDGFVYLRSEPEISLQRLQKRDRVEERGVPLDYLRSLHNKHDYWLKDKKNWPLLSVQRDVPVLILDCNVEFEDNPDRQKTLLDQLTKFVDSINPL
jgi:deoxycitidine kinase